MTYEQEFIQILQLRRPVIEDLKHIRSLNLPHGCIAAGYVRNTIWDHLHHYPHQTLLNDVDVLYFDPDELSEETEKECEIQLKQQRPEYNWSVKNQARMHLRNNDAPYRSVEDAMKRWPETATAVGVQMDANGAFHVIAPFGLDDLFELNVRKSPYFKDLKTFDERIITKKWLERWPKLQIFVD